MVTRVEGTPQEVAARVNAYLAEQSLRHTRHAIALVMVDESAMPGMSPPSDTDFQRLMTEAASDTVSSGHMDDSREAMYTRMDGE
jgi:hypothetical protein